jgi:hypothetical protein
VTHEYGSPDEWIDFLLALNVPLRQHLAGASDEQIRQARRAAVAATRLS